MKTQVDETVQIPTRHGLVELITFRSLCDGREHFTLGFGDWKSHSCPRVRIHSECVTGDVLGSQRCDCGPQLEEAIVRFSKSSGLILYLRQEGRGIGLLNKIRAYRLQDQGLDTYAANRQLGFADDEREYKVAADMLKALGIQEVHLHSNNPRKSQQLEANGVKVSRRIFTQTHMTTHNHRYLAAKSEIGKHDGLNTNLSLNLTKR